MPSIGRSGKAASVLGSVYRRMLLHPGINARQSGSTLRDLPQGFRTGLFHVSGQRRAPRGFALTPTGSFERRRNTDIQQAFVNRFGPDELSKIRTEAGTDFKNRILEQQRSRFGTLGPILTSSGSRRRGRRDRGYSPTLAEKTILGG